MCYSCWCSGCDVEVTGAVRSEATREEVFDVVVGEEGEGDGGGRGVCVVVV